jgi:hypothetical protein
MIRYQNRRYMGPNLHGAKAKTSRACEGLDIHIVHLL